MATDRAARLRLVKARVQGVLGLVRLVYAITRGKIDEVWVGDSNAVLFATHRFPIPPLSPVGGRRFVWHLGPRLMYSIATNGFPPLMQRVASLLSHLPGTRAVTYVFSFGEIDVRCHLVAHLDDSIPPFVETYVVRVRALARTLGIRRAIIVTPSPPSPAALQHESFPVLGSLLERMTAYRRVVEGLRMATKDPGTDPVVALFDVSRALAGADGSFRPELTYDGTHPNDAGREVIRREFRAQCASG